MPNNEFPVFVRTVTMAPEKTVTIYRLPTGFYLWHAWSAASMETGRVGSELEAVREIGKFCDRPPRCPGDWKAIAGIPLQICQHDGDILGTAPPVPPQAAASPGGSGIDTRRSA